MRARTLALTAGASYIVIFFAAIFANFLVLENLGQDPVGTVQNASGLVRWGILAFLVTVVFDVVVAWALYELFKTHPLSGLSTLFRMMHAAIMGVGVFALPAVLSMDSAEAILGQVEVFNTIWLIGLFFFGIHLIILARILGRPQWIAGFLVAAGVMYMADTAAHFLLPDYDRYAEVFLALVAVPSILGEMALAVWLLVKGGRNQGGALRPPID
ncbi:DUF4386 domain-containing protein [Robiginitalea sediminis]|uniref:DUF4386 domain-containing protein n=1 Tax=Robiginitalea sediminis TaxID=1982593 RepID=UPI000B4A69C6|nr:DUF4386 domain-containing protein [Robiginitalea sediminis]